MVTILSTVKAPHYVLSMGSVMVLTMFFTYSACVHQNECPALPHLPTISNTWDNPPGNFLSRFIVSHVALAMALAQYVIWTPLANTKKCEKLLLALGLFSIFCFSIVGAICDDDSNPQCRGNGVIHSVCAVTFLVLYTMNMILISFVKDHQKPNTAGNVALKLLALLAMVSKLRWLPLVAPTFVGNFGDQTVIAVIEWTDVLVVISWTVFYVWKNRQSWSFRLQIEDDSDTGRTSSTDTTIFRCSVYAVTIVVLVLFFGTLTVCYYFITKQGRVPKGSFPWISDMFVMPPGNWISRWTLVFGATLSGFGQVCLYFMDGTSGVNWMDKAMTGLSLFAILGLAVVGCVNEKELHWLHFTAAGVFFVGYDVFMILRTCRTTSSAAFTVRSKCMLGVLCVVSCCCTWFRCFDSGSAFLKMVGVGNDEHLTGYVLPVIEWLDALTIVCYMSGALFAHGKKTAQNIGLAIVWTEEEEDAVALAVGGGGVGGCVCCCSSPSMQDTNALGVPLTSTHSMEYSEMR